MHNKKIKIRKQKELCVLSDTLPYEIPLIFSNRYFFNFLTKSKISYQHGKIDFSNSSLQEKEIFSVIFSGEVEEEIETCLSITNTKATVPFGYKIDHKKSEFRELSIPHPRNQIFVIDFYDQYKNLITYFSSKSEFSIRKPVKAASYIYYKDSLHYLKLNKSDHDIEISGKEYESLKTFFKYEKHGNIHEFYESNKFHSCEKKYNYLLKLDISKCFDSIYTHSICWAILGKDSVKYNLKESKHTFSGKFDVLMQQMNHSETNGIIIGPEFSRIFSELIFQKNDINVQKKLDEIDIQHRVDYEIFRYVDDYFIFYNDSRDKDLLIAELSHSLREFKLSINHEKTTLYEKPMITGITISKNEISALFEEKISYKEELTQDKEREKTYHVYINDKELIVRLKSILKQNNTEYSMITNYTFSLIEKKYKKIIKQYRFSPCTEKMIVNFSISILRLVFFIFYMNPKFNSTIKLCRILELTFILMENFSSDSSDRIKKLIFDESKNIMKKNKSSKYTQLETNFLLTSLQKLGKEYKIDEKNLAHYFRIKNDQGEYKTEYNLNYFSIIMILFYIERKTKYNTLRSFVEKIILDKFAVKCNTHKNDTELTFLFFDTISCPYVSNTTKEKLFSYKKIRNEETKDYIKKHLWFTAWTGFDITKALDEKYGKEVY